MIKTILLYAYSIATQFGFDPRRFFNSIRGLPFYANDLRRFRKGHFGRMTIKPCLNDRYEEGGVTKSEYFWQDLLVARRIFEARPVKHVDIGSRIDGFVAHVASFRDIEVLDIRPITTKIPGVIFKQADLMNAKSVSGLGAGYCDSLSCLHAIEHFGLGRYGDPIDTQGHARGMENMALLLRPNGIFYLSTPIGIERVEFNANRVFNPQTIVNLAVVNGLLLRRLTVFVHGYGIKEIQVDSDAIDALAASSYSLGIFEFQKVNPVDRCFDS